MENEQSYAAADEGGRSLSRRVRLMGKLFGAKDRKASENASAASLDAFLYSSADSLSVSHPPPPPPPPPPPGSAQAFLPKIDTNTSSFPQSSVVNQQVPQVQQGQQNRGLAPGRVESPRRSPRASRKGLRVRFADTNPEVIGEGGDESEIPVRELSTKKKQTQPPPPPLSTRRPAPSPNRPPGTLDGEVATARGGGSLQPNPKRLSRSQAGYLPTYERGAEPEPKSRPNIQESLPGGQAEQKTLAPGKFLGAAGRKDDDRKSFIEIHQAQMALAEGRAFAKAVRNVSAASEHNWENNNKPGDTKKDPESQAPLDSSTDGQANQPSMAYSPAASISSASSTYSPSHLSPSKQRSKDIARRPSAASQNEDEPAPRPPPPSMAARAASVRLTDAVAAREAIGTFVSRTKHLFALFRLHAESIRPLSACSQVQCARGALWWFLKGRMGLEVAIRDRPSSPQSQMQNELDRQQAYSNLAKTYWLCEEVVPEIMQSQGSAKDPEVSEVAQTLVSGLTKLAMSMKRNGFLPPEDRFLPQTIDKSIWVEYPPLSQDMVALLTGNWGSGLTAMQNPMSHLELLDAFPVGDTAETFSFGRVLADVFLMEQGRENQRLYFSCMLSMVRPQKESGLVFVLASQDGSIQLPIQEHKNTGPVWEDVRWRNDTCCFDVRLPRGFKLAVQLPQNDYRTLYNMYDYASKLRASLQPRSDEQVVFRNTLRSFQYMDGDPNSRIFPKEPISQCEVALFERIYKESGPAGPRSWHTGFRIAVVTGNRTRTACGVHHSFPPLLPIQFGFFRADGNSPAFSVKFDTGRQKGRMIMVFSDEKERLRFHSLLTGTALDHGEKVFADVPIRSFTISRSLREPEGVSVFSRMPWSAGRVVNDEYSPEGEEPTTVLADKLRIVLEYQHGTITDRVNVAPGELRMRLEVSNSKLLRLLRQPQQDMTLSISESGVPKELSRNMSEALRLIKSKQTIRTIEFNTVEDLHKFQAAVTGFEVIFDARAATFAISRRRMVVPIHKKWEAGYTRIQVIKQEDKQLQLLAFFEDFSHGHCMNFVLKVTDVYETFHRGSKSGIKFVDAKFPLPRLPADKDGDFDDMAFVCLDLPDLPGEHDDISIMFENEEDRDRLCQCLPAPVKGSSRMSRVK